MATGDAEVSYYEHFDLGPGFQLAVLHNGQKITSFDISHFSSLFTYNHGNPMNVGETDGWYGTSEFSEEFLMPPFILKLIRKKIGELPPEIRTFVNQGLDKYRRMHIEEYEQFSSDQG